MGRMRPSDRRAKNLARKVLGKDFKTIFDKGFVSFNIKVQIKKGEVETRRIYLCKDFRVYTLNKKRSLYYRYCSILLEYRASLYDANEYPAIYYQNVFSDYDKLIAYYLWLKHYSKVPAKLKEFKQQFNLIQTPLSYRQFKAEIEEE